ncbi:MAG: hypothetical protein QM753_06875 [Thermomicrobiales bacterium]
MTDRSSFMPLVEIVVGVELDTMHPAAFVHYDVTDKRAIADQLTAGRYLDA